MHTQHLEIHQIERSAGITQPQVRGYDDEVALIERFQGGDTAVFDRLFVRYQPRIHRVIGSIILNPEDTADLTQDVFLRAYRGLTGFKKGSQFYSWLYRIAINCCIDFMRQKAVRKLIVNQPPCGEVLYTYPLNRRPITPTQALDNKEMQAHLRTAIMQLTPKRREVFILRYFEGLSVKEIAHKMRRSPGTIKAHLFHAREKLQDEIRSYLKGDHGTALIMAENSPQLDLTSEIDVDQIALN